MTERSTEPRQPNTAFKAARQGLLMSQDEMARAVREAGQRAGEPNDCSKRLVQRWEAGIVTTPRGTYARALEYVTGQPIANLGFAAAAERYGLDRRQALGMAGAAATAWALPRTSTAAHGPLTGIWLSKYEYTSSGRGGQTFTSQHYVVIIQHGGRAQLRSLPGTAPGRLLMDLTANGQVVTGTWTEETDPGGYYGGAVYHGAVQFLAEPSGHRLAGKWVGFGRDFDLNTGPWTLQLVSADVSREAIQRYDRAPDDDAAS